MSRRNEVEIALSLEDRMSRGLENAGRNVKTFERRVRDNLFVLGAVGGIATGAALSIKSIADAAREGQVAQQQLGQVIENTGGSWEAMESRVQETILALERATAVGDAQLARALTRLTTVVGDADLALQALPTVLDAAAVSGSSVETVAGTLGRALAGAANTAESLGITFDESANFAERLAQAQEIAGGAAAAAKTPTDDLRISWENFQEMLGEKAIPVVDATSEALSGLLGILNTTIQGPLDEIEARVQSLAERGLDPLQARLQELARQIDERNNPSIQEWGAQFIDANGNLVEMESALRDLRTEYALVNEAINNVTRSQGEEETAIQSVSLETEKYTSRVQELQGIRAQEDAAFKNRLIAIRAETEALEEGERAMQERINVALQMIQAGRAHTEEMAAERDAQQELEEIVRSRFAAIEVLNRQLEEESRSMRIAEQIMRGFERGLLTAEQAEKGLAEALQTVQGELDQQNNKIREQIALVEERIRQQERLTGQRLTGPEANLPTLAQMESVFQGFVQNALQAGGQTIEGGVQVGGNVFTLDQFISLVQSLAQGGLTGETSPLIAAIQQLNQLAGFQTSFGQFRTIPGSFNQPVPIMAHGGEIIGRPGAGSVHFHFEGSFIGNSLEFQRMVAQAQRDYRRRGGGRG